MRSIATLIVASVFTLVAASGCYDTVPAGIDYSSAGDPVQTADTGTLGGGPVGTIDPAPTTPDGPRAGSHDGSGTTERGTGGSSGTTTSTPAGWHASCSGPDCAKYWEDYPGTITVGCNSEGQTSANVNNINLARCIGTLIDGPHDNSHVRAFYALDVCPSQESVSGTSFDLHNQLHAWGDIVGFSQQEGGSAWFRIYRDADAMIHCRKR